MSANEKEDERSFLSRWSQRKSEARFRDDDGLVIKPTDETRAPSAGDGVAEEPFDLSKLPKLEEITEATDITVFLRKGVPESIRNAALRKSWALDSAVRNYVNPALDYAYDWNTPGGVPGNSDLSAGTDIARMVLQIMGSDPDSPDLQDSGTQIHNAERDDVRSPSSITAAQDGQPELQLQQVQVSISPRVSTPANVEPESKQIVSVENIASTPASESIASQQKVRRHGTAKPRA